MYFSKNIAPCLGLLSCLPAAFAGFSSTSSSNVAVYWGQNSYGQSSGTLVQQRLSYYCANMEIDIIPLAFMVSVTNPVLNFANQGDVCTAISGSTLFYCSQLEADITTCQKTYGKTILLSIGGATYTEGGFSSSAAAVTAANNIWSWFGPYSSSAVRPFGTAVVDGFDFDFETTVSNMPAFANQLRTLMNANTSKQWILSAAPQCPYPDAADGPMLAGAVSFDVIWVQFYNNYCGLQSFVSGSSTQNNFNFATWDTWAKTVSRNPNVKVMLGIPANTGAAGNGYESGTLLANIIAYSKSFSSFGGVMMWDISQLYANSGFLDAVNTDLGNPASAPPTTTTVTLPGTTMTTVTTTSAKPTTTGGTVSEWNQCGGSGWTGGTVCVAGTTCTVYSVWYSQCNPS